MDDLVRWLTVQLDEDERIARAAGHLSGSLSSGVPDVGRRWRVSGSHADDGGTYWSVTTASPDLDRVPVVEMVGSGMSGGGAHTAEVAAHIAAHDPARVLREIEAKRRTLAEYEDAVEEMERAKRDFDQDAYQAARVTRTVLGRSVRRDAAVYEGHPGYREEWRA